MRDLRVKIGVLQTRTLCGKKTSPESEEIIKKDARCTNNHHDVMHMHYEYADKTSIKG
jgi:hypothetical protein